MRILLTNDDGIYAPGLWALYKRFTMRHSVTVVAPDRERSAVGHAITLDRPLRVNRVQVDGGFKGYSVTGTPADCIKLGILEILEVRPDLAISGINPGANVGININYSGTVAAAREASLYGIPALSVSLQGNSIEGYDDSAAFIEKLTDYIIKNRLPFGTFLNVNFPEIPLHKVEGIRFSRQSISLFDEYFEKRTDPRNRTYFWQGCDVQPISDNPDIDSCALLRNYISITPIKSDTTDYGILQELNQWGVSTGDTESEQTGSG